MDVVNMDFMGMDSSKVSKMQTAWNLAVAVG